MVKGLASISDIQLYWKSCEDTFLASPSAAHYQNLILPLSNVYSLILEYQIRAVHHLSKTQFSRAWQKVGGWSDWSQKTTDIEKATEAGKAYIPPLQQREARENFSTEMSKLDKLFQTERDILQLMHKSRLEDKEERVLHELYAAGFGYASNKNFNPVQVQGTCEWFFSNHEFCNWRDASESDLFWISAGPGCGKSVLSRALVDDGHLQSSSSTISFSDSTKVENHTTTTCYFFFKDDDSRRNNLASALCAILHQLFTNAATAVLISHAVEAHRVKGQGMVNDCDGLWNILVQCANEWSGGAIICLLDALDECQNVDRKLLLALLKKYHSRDRRAGKLKFFITCRPYDDIEQSFGILARHARILHFDGDGKSNEINSDINLVIDARMDDFAVNFEPSDRLEIAQHLKRQEMRTYLWLHLTLEIISDSPSEYSRPGDVEALLQSLPQQLSEAYEKILNRTKNRPKAIVLLSILLAATRPLTLIEANYALTIALGETPSRTHKEIADRRWKSDFKSAVKNLCGLLINVYDDKLSFIHLTAREFLVSKSYSNLEWEGLLEDRSSINKGICKCCISYLLLDDWTKGLHDPLSTEFLEAFPFFSYAAASWVPHLTSLDSTSYNALKVQARLLITRKAPYLRLWAEHNLSSDPYPPSDVFDGWSTSNIFDGWTELAMASFLGLRGIVHDMLAEDGLDVNAWSAKYGSALQAAVASNRMDITKILLDHGADVNYMDGGRGSALRDAVKQDNIALVELLLSYGADPRAGGKTSQDGSLLSAARAGNGEIFRAILSSLVNLDTVEGVEKAVIDKSIMGRHRECMSMLLDVLGPGMPVTQRMAEVLMNEVEFANKVLQMISNRPSQDIVVTPHMFQQAAKGIKDLNSLRVILKAKDDYNMPLTDKVLEATAKSSDVETMHLLLKQFAEPSVTYEMLVGAISNQPQQCVDMLQFLLSHETRIIEIDECLLETAVRAGDVSLVKLIATYPGFKGQVTQRMIIATTHAFDYNDELVQFLVQQCDAEVLKDEVFIARTARRATTETMQLLLDRLGNDFVPSGNVLCAAAGQYHVSMLKLLVEQYGEHVSFTENLLRAPVSDEVLEWLLKEHGAEFTMNAGLLLDIVTANYRHLDLIAKYKHQDLKRLASTALLAVAQDMEPARVQLKLLTDRYVTANMISEDILLAILRKERAGQVMVARIVEQYGQDLVIGANVLNAVATLRDGAPRLLNLIKTNCPRYFRVTGSMIEAAARAGREDVLLYLSDPGSSGTVSTIQDMWWLAARFEAAAEMGDTRAMQQAIDGGADPNLPNIDGETALDRAVARRFTRAVEFLVAQPGINVNVRDSLGYTPLYTAVLRRCQRSVSLLLAAGADPDEEARKGRTPYLLAWQQLSKNDEILVMLRAAKQR